MTRRLLAVLAAAVLLPGTAACKAPDIGRCVYTPPSTGTPTAETPRWINRNTR